MNYTLDQFNEDVDTFNIIAGKLPDCPTLRDIDAQIKLVVEEVTELSDDFKAGNYEGALDGLCDAFYTLCFLKTLMEANGYMTTDALKETAQNNLSKFIPNTPEGNKIVKQTLEYYAALNVAVFAELHGPTQSWVIKNENQKVMKPVNFVPNNLLKFVPPTHREWNKKDV